MGCGSTNEWVEIEVKRGIGGVGGAWERSGECIRANKSLQSQYTQENPKVINGLHIIKDAFQHIRINKEWNLTQRVSFLGNEKKESKYADRISQIE